MILYEDCFENKKKSKEKPRQMTMAKMKEKHMKY